jgi:predicted adenylyl cyclase CyaB
MTRTMRGQTPSGAPRRNVELKAVDPDPDRSLAVCRAIGAADHDVIRQRDTYFDVRRGALKLREETPGRPHLIHYERAAEPRARQSSYRIVAVADPDGLREALAAAFGVRCVVEKQRHLFVWRDVRIHLDDVDGLGRFIELEAVAPADSDLTAEHELVAELRRAFGLADEHLRGQGYAEAQV